MSRHYVAVAPDKFARGFDGTHREVPAAYEVLELREALARVYRSDAHLVAYVVESSRQARQVRITKPGLAHFPEPVSVGVLFCDVDNPGHGVWTPEAEAAAREAYATLPILQTAGVYHTAHGARIVQPLAVPVPVAEVEPQLERWLSELAAAGLAVDMACRDWTRHFRLPHVQRKGKPYRSPFVSLDTMCAIELAPIVRPATPEPTTSRGDGSRDDGGERSAPMPDLRWAETLPEVWREHVPALAEAVRSVTTEWHTLFLALSGALLRRGVPAAQLPLLIEAVSRATSDSKTADRVTGARTTVANAAAGRSVVGYTTLRREWPAVADAVDAACARGIERRVRETLRTAEPRRSEMTAAEAADGILHVLRSLPDGVTTVRAECGVGKTHAALRLAAERAGKLHAAPSTLAASDRRAPVGSKTAILAPTHRLAQQVVADLAAMGVTAKRYFSPVSHRQPDGTPTCRYHEAAVQLASGGQSVRWHFCDGHGVRQCPAHQNCPARLGVEGSEDARVAVAPHGLARAADEFVGCSGALICDEPPPPLRTLALSREDLAFARDRVELFERSFAAAVAPALAALSDWFERAALEEATPLANAVQAGAVPHTLLDAARAATKLGDALAVELAQHALGDDLSGKPPPIPYAEIHRARRDLRHAAELGRASRVARLVYGGLLSPTPVSVRVTEAESPRVLLVTDADPLYGVLRARDGASALIDANADLLRPLLAVVLEYEPPYHAFGAPDGAPIARTLLVRQRANRKAWLPRGALRVDARLKSALCAVLDWAREDPATRSVGLLTFMPLAIAIRAARGEPELQREWSRAGQPAEAFDQTVEALRPIVDRWRGELHLGYYGALRGLDHMKHLDAIATLGDPWPNLDAVAHEAAFLGAETDADARAEALCRAELEQAHGRLRTIHRTRPGRALHLGAVVPGGPKWSGPAIDVRQSRGGRPPAAPATGVPLGVPLDVPMTRAEFALAVFVLGGVRAMASRLECSSSTVCRYRDGLRPVPGELAGWLRMIIRGAGGDGSLRWEWTRHSLFDMSDGQNVPEDGETST